METLAEALPEGQRASTPGCEDVSRRWLETGDADARPKILAGGPIEKNLFAGPQFAQANRRKVELFSAAAQDVRFVALDMHVPNLGRCRLFIADLDLDIVRRRAAAILYDNAADENHIRHIIGGESRVREVGNIDLALPIDDERKAGGEQDEKYPDKIAHK